MTKIESSDYKDRTYLSAIEAAKYLGISVETLHNLVNKFIKAQVSASGQMRFDLKELKKYEEKFKNKIHTNKKVQNKKGQKNENNYWWDRGTGYFNLRESYILCVYK